jgi:hypothetical protein
MGCCCSSDALPDVPQEIKLDPDFNATITVLTPSTHPSIHP